MTSAGRILIMPKGEYNPSATYEMLDLVYFNGTSWVAKKTTVGIEPNTDNGEYWQQMSDFSFLDERKQEREYVNITIKAGESYKHIFTYGESCLLYAYFTSMEYACIYACCGENEWSYNITKLSEAKHGDGCSAAIGSVGGEDLNTITFTNESDTDKKLVLIKLPFFKA